MSKFTDNILEILTRYPSNNPGQEESVRRFRSHISGHSPELEVSYLYRLASATQNKTDWAYYWIAVSLDYLRLGKTNLAESSLQEVSRL